MIDFMYTQSGTLQMYTYWKPIFYFGPKEIQKSWPEGKYYKSYEELEEAVQFLRYITENPGISSLNYDDICELEEDMINFRNYYCKSIGLYIPFGEGPYSSDLKMIANFKKELLIRENPDAALYYSENAVVVMTEDEKVNGYSLYPVDKEIMEYDLFIELRRCSDRFISDEEFLEWLKENTCSDWVNMSRTGLVRGDNFKRLFELPYPRELLKRTFELEFGESVRYSNFVCEWIKRKARLMYKCPTLKSLCARMVPYDENLPEDIRDILLPADSELPLLEDAVEKTADEVVWNRVRLINYESRFVLPEKIDAPVDALVEQPEEIGDTIGDKEKAALLWYLLERYKSRDDDEEDSEDEERHIRMEDVD